MRRDSLEEQMIIEQPKTRSFRIRVILVFVTAEEQILVKVGNLDQPAGPPVILMLEDMVANLSDFTIRDRLFKKNKTILD